MKTEKILQTEAARQAGVSKQLINDMVKRGQLSTSIDEGGRRWIVCNDLWLSYLRRRKKVASD